MKAVKQLLDELGMTTIFGSNDLFKTFERNINKEDSMIYILATVQENLDTHLQTNEEQYFSVIFFAGGWTEGMYIGSKTVNQNANQITGRLMEQIGILENLIPALEQYPEKNSFLDDLIVDFKKINTLYQNFESVKKQAPDNISFKDITLTKEEAANFTAAIANLRSKIVNG